MGRGLQGAVLGAIATLLVVLLSASGIISLRSPFGAGDLVPDLPEVMTTSTVIVPEEPVVYRIEPIALDCRARVHAAVPLEGRKEHEAFGRVYRTDTVTLEARGDVDTCVDADLVRIIESTDGTFHIDIPGEAIRFERPRVDAFATRDSVDYDKGLLGKMSDALPWVSDNDGLTTTAYAFAQEVIGGSECMEQAYRVTSELLVDAYEEQLLEQGADPSQLEITIGEPDFGQNQATDLEGFDFTVESERIHCSLSPDAFEGAVVDTDLT